VATSKMTGGGGDKGRTISLEPAVHLGHMLRALMTKKKKKYLEKSLSQRHFFRHKSHMDWSGMENVRPR